MKNNRMIAAIAVLMTVCGCQKPQNIFDSAIEKVFMPQTRVEGGIVYNEYSVPEADDPDVRHHIVENGHLKVILGVRSSQPSKDGYSVRVSSDAVYTETVLPTIEKSIALPAEMFSLPSEVSVPGGKNGDNFFLDVDLNALKKDYTESFSSKFVVTVRISDPSGIEMNESRSRTVVIIDGRNFIPQSVHVSLLQATMLNGGVTNHYPVPFDSSSENYTFDATTMKLEIPFSVTRNGEKPFDAFTVNAAVDETAASSQVTSIEKGVLLPSNVVSVPAVANVRNGQTSGNFTVSVNLADIITAHPEWSKSKLVTAVTISNPSLYELNTSAATAVVIIDAKKFYPKPEPVNLVKGGTFSSGDDAFWTTVNSDGGAGKGLGVRPAQASVRDGRLLFTVTERCFHTFYQQVNITETGEYQMVLTYHNDGSVDAAGRVYACFSPETPVTDVTFAHQNYVAARLENNIKTAFEGDFFAGSLAQKFGGLTNAGKFTVDVAGTYYVVLGVEMWGGSLNAWFDDFKLFKSEEE